MRGAGSDGVRWNVTRAYTLVATSDVSGRPLGPQRLVNYGVAGAVLADLGIAGRIKVDLDNGDLVRVICPEPLQDPVLDEVLGRLVESPTNLRVSTWVKNLRSNRLRTAVLDDLVDVGLLERRSSHVLGVVPAPRFRESDCRPEDEIVESVRAALRGSRPPDAVTACVIVLADGTRVLTKVVDEVPPGAVERIVADEETSEVARKVARVIKLMRLAMAANPTP